LASTIILPKSFKSDFAIKITNPKKKIINYSGKVYFSNTTELKWDYRKPTKKEVCTNGKELIVVDHDLEQVSQYKMNKGLNLSEVLGHAKKHKKHIYLAEFQGKKYTIQLDAKQRLNSIAFFDELDNKVQIIFKNIKYNKHTLSVKSMQCKYPKNYDMIRG
jgi:outer membrane lipoprotein carrier protein